VWKLIALAAVLAGLAALFTWRRRRIELAFRRAIDRRPKAPNGVVVGAEGFVLERPGAPGVLLLHGAGDTPLTLRYLADELHRRGFHVSAPLLPGHGRDLDAFARVTAREIVGAARTTFDQLRANHEWVGLIGLSMGTPSNVSISKNAKQSSPDLPRFRSHANRDDLFRSGCNRSESAFAVNLSSAWPPPWRLYCLWVPIELCSRFHSPSPSRRGMRQE